MRQIKARGQRPVYSGAIVMERAEADRMGTLVAGNQARRTDPDEGGDDDMHRDDAASERLGVLLIVGSAAAGWIWLAVAIAGSIATSDPARFGPGMAVFERFSDLAGLPPAVAAALATLCSRDLASGWSWGALAIDAGMWIAMVLAMMLPGAAPVLVGKGRGLAPLSSTALLMSGYLAVWIAFSVVMAGAQVALEAARLVNGPMGAMVTTLATTTLAAAALYQFTPMKRACLDRCRHPPRLFEMPETAGARLREGIARGLDCLGCCWVMMAAMLAVGVMNVVWMIGLTAAMTLEKASDGRWSSRVIGLALLALAAGLFAQSPAGMRLLGL